jgi:hypothetical protein
MPDEPSVPRDRGARPSLDQVLALRADRMATVRQVIADLTDEKPAGMTRPVMEPGYPEPESFAVRECLLNILNEEWEHRLYAERDFDVLESQSSCPARSPRRRVSAKNGVRHDCPGVTAAKQDLGGFTTVFREEAFSVTPPH